MRILRKGTSSLAIASSVIVFLLIAFFSIPQPVVGAEIWTTNSSFNAVDEFYDNETVYITSNDITDGISKQIRIYVVENRNNWMDGDTLTDVSGGYAVITTNSTGQINTSASQAFKLWENPDIDAYDIVADVNMSGKYNETVDFINSLSTTGFEVQAAPKPTLTIEKGSESQNSHDWDPVKNTSEIVMLQFNATADAIEDVKMNSVILKASGTGNDKSDVNYVSLIADSNNNGIRDSNEDLIAYGAYPQDNSVLTLEIANGYIIPAELSIPFLIVYEMDNSSQGNTYKFDISMITASGAYSGDSATINGLPIGSSIITVSTISTVTTSTSVPVDECETDNDCNGVSCSDKKKTSYTCELDNAKNVKVCAETIQNVLCCTGDDCVEGYYCSDYVCVKEGGIFSWILGVQQFASKNYVWTIVSTSLIVIVVIVIFVLIKNQTTPASKKQPLLSRKISQLKKLSFGRKTPWKGERDYDREWERLRKKWKEEKK